MHCRITVWEFLEATKHFSPDFPGAAAHISGAVAFDGHLELAAGNLPGGAIHLPVAAAHLAGDAAQFPGAADHLTGDAAHLPGAANPFAGDAAHLHGAADQIPGDDGPLAGDAAHLAGDAVHLSGAADHLAGDADHLPGDAAPLHGAADHLAGAPVFGDALLLLLSDSEDSLPALDNAEGDASFNVEPPAVLAADLSHHAGAALEPLRVIAALNACSVCLESTPGPQAVILPCWHLKVCRRCITTLVQVADEAGVPARCPNCNGDILSVHYPFM